MAMLQTIFLSIVLLFQSTFASMFMTSYYAKPFDYGGDPYVEPVISAYLPIYVNCVTDYVIVYPDDAAQSILTGARWLKEYTAAMTHTAGLAAYTVSHRPEGKKYIALGDTGLDGGALAGAKAQLKDEGFVKKVIDDNIYIYGIGRGTMYGCSSFIEEQLDCHWYTPDLKVIPDKKDISIDKNLNNIQNTALEYRDVSWKAVDTNPEWKAFHKINSGLFSYLGEEYGYGVNYIDFCHTMCRLVPDSLYAEHPEYFSYRESSKSRTTGQRCLTNPDILRITIESVFEKIRNSPPDYNIISVTQNDNSDVCQCPNCLAMDARYGGPSGTNIWFVNQVADAVKKEFPDRNIKIDTFAYDYTTHAPTNILPRNNVIVRLCTINSCFCHPIAECGHSRSENIFDMYSNKESSYAKDFSDWSALCKQSGAKLYVWDYTSHFKCYSEPFPNFQVLAPNIQFFIDNSVYGVYEQGNNDCSRNGEFCELCAYLLAKLLWNPHENVEHLINEFMNAYYGKASAPYVKAYLDLISQKAINTSHLFIFGRPEENLYFTPSDYKQCDAFWDKAEENAANKYQLDNVRRSRLSLRIHKANMVTCEFSLSNPNRLQENKKLFNDMIMLGVDNLKDKIITMPYNLYIWSLRPWEWSDPISWVEFVDPSKVVPFDPDLYRSTHQEIM
jgi:hypothetical protein